MDRPSSFAPPRALYVHIPVCRSRCAYCDFHSLSSASWSPAALEGLVDGILARVDGLFRRFPPDDSFLTAYVGGGTPTALPRPLLERLLQGLAVRLSRVRQPREWTLEANPESLDEEALDIAEAAGVTRISLGVQSLDDGLLSRLGRIASSEVAMGAVGRAVARPGLRVSADLISGLPRKARPSGGLAHEVSALLEAGVGHLSIYDLTLEEGTRLYAEVESGDFRLPDPDEALDERLEAETLLRQAGFRRYEVSNFAPEGNESLHNLVYWHMDSYLGAGPGAVSTLVPSGSPAAAPGVRPGGRSSLRIEEGRMVPGRGQDPALETPIGPRDSVFEAILMAYRTAFGLDEDAFEARSGLSSEDLIGRTRAAWRGRLVPAAPWPRAFAAQPAAGPSQALDSEGLDLLNRFLVDCLSELETFFPEVSGRAGPESGPVSGRAGKRYPFRDSEE